MHQEYTLNAQNYRDAMTAVWRAVCEIVRGGELVLILTDAHKSRAQERKYHALIGDIASQVSFFGKRRYSAEAWKAMLIDAFEKERAGMGQPLRCPGELVPSLDGRNMVSIRPSSTKFSREEGSDFIEFLYAQGQEMGVKWSAASWQILEGEKVAA